jgi:hypothetical protein
VRESSSFLFPLANRCILVEAFCWGLVALLNTAFASSKRGDIFVRGYNLKPIVRYVRSIFRSGRLAFSVALLVLAIGLVVVESDYTTFLANLRSIPLSALALVELGVLGATIFAARRLQQMTHQTAHPVSFKRGPLEEPD